MNRTFKIGPVVLFLITALVLSAPALAGWEQTFGDEFNASSLDLTKWKKSDLWGNRTLYNNNEQQCYMADVFSMENGQLRIKAEKRFVSQAECRGSHSDLAYASGMITTAGCNQWESGAHCTGLQPFSQAYGYFEMRAKLTKGKGFWPAFWLLPINGSWPPEIDVMEALGHQPNRAYMTFHYKDAAGAKRATGTNYNGPDFTAGYHTFGVDWQPGLLVYYIDGIERARVSNSFIPSEPMYILANLAVGGKWPGYPDSTTEFPSYFEIDYIRAYKRVANGQPDSLPPNAVKPTPTQPTPTPTPNPTPKPTPPPSNDVTPPNVKIIFPLPGAFLPALRKIPIEAVATDQVGVRAVKFFVNGQQICSRKKPPYVCQWQVPEAPGANYRIAIFARDHAGNKSITRIVKVKSR